VPPEQAGPLAALGRFLRANGAGIYGSRPDDALPPVEVDGARVMAVRVGRRRFALVAGPAAGTIRLPGWQGVTAFAQLSGEPVEMSRADAGVSLVVPRACGGQSLVLEILA
jgi:hypothetical protein